MKFSCPLGNGQKNKLCFTDFKFERCDLFDLILKILFFFFVSFLLQCFSFNKSLVSVGPKCDFVLS